ncbi:branched-chain amino acid ABC transporter permease [Thioclava sp. 'Guangxiensis']|uniref:branched-chain amino acid ABC transporter permease n=1 Tax=Thioclava sp. 'Guangxiensis' TaxID=3149044 RepID=UPI003877DBEE
MSSRQAESAAGGALRTPLLFVALLVLFGIEAATSGWNAALVILNMGVISAIMALGLNLQWGYAGLFNAGTMGFIALGGLAPVLISMPATQGAMGAGGWRVLLALAIAVAVLALSVQTWKQLRKGVRGLATIIVLIVGFFVFRAIFDPAVSAVEAINPSAQGYLGGLGLPVLMAWPVGALLAAIAAWAIGKAALGLRSDYLAIATLGIAEIIVAVLKNENWLDRGVMNVNGIPRPFFIPREIDLQASADFVARAADFGMDPVLASTIFVKLLYLALFAVVLIIFVAGTQLALHSPWGRMMRAIRENEVAASAMGKNVTKRHLQIFIIGSAICGFAGAMMVTLDGQLTPATYNPLRFTFLIMVMVILGGSGNNWGAVLGGILVWYLWIKAEAWGPELLQLLTSGMEPGALKDHLLESAAQMRYLAMGLVLLVVLRFAPRGLLPER